MGYRPWDRKGWTVCIHNVVWYQALVIYPDKTRRFVASRSNRQDAINCAITAAAKYGTLDWKATRAWFEKYGEKYGVTLSYESATVTIPEYTRKEKPSKGWYIEPNYYSTADGKKRKVISVFFGRRSSDSVYQLLRPTRRAAVKYVLEHRDENPYYNEHETVKWMRENGMFDMIPWSKKQRGAA
jgi:hypothetical protein